MAGGRGRDDVKKYIVYDCMLTMSGVIMVLWDCICLLKTPRPSPNSGAVFCH